LFPRSSFADTQECIKILREFGAAEGTRQDKPEESALDDSTQRQQDNMRVEFDELEMIDRIGAGAFGEIYKCRWRGTLVAAKIIKSAKIRRDWVHKRMLSRISEGHDVDDAIHEMEKAEDAAEGSVDKDQAIADFRQEISVLKQLRHPNIVLLLAYSTTENYECLISELMKCSLLDVFKSHIVQGTKMKHKTQIVYATHLSRGMTYLHSCKPPIIHRDLVRPPSFVRSTKPFGATVRERHLPNVCHYDISSFYFFLVSFIRSVHPETGQPTDRPQRCAQDF
jgi:serine/threonine protein kinase